MYFSFHDIKNQHRETLLQSISREVLYFTQGIEESITQFKWSLENLSEDEIIFIFSKEMRLHTAITQIQYINSNGTIIRTNPDKFEYNNIDISNTTYFKDYKKLNSGNWSNSFYNPSGGRPSIAYKTTLNDNYLISYIDLESLLRITESTKIGDTGLVYLTDKMGRIIAHPDIQLVKLRESLSHRLPESLAEGEFFFNIEDRQVMLTYKIPQLEWNIGITQDYIEFYKIIFQVLLSIVVIIGVTLIISIFFSVLHSKNITKPLYILSDKTRDIINRQYKLIMPDFKIVEINELAETFTNMAKEIRTRENKLIKSNEKLDKSLSGKQTLLQEVHHRVKNNLALLSSMFNLKAQDISSNEMKRFLNEAISRIHSIAAVHEMLYAEGNLDHLPFHDYIKNISTFVSQLYSHEVDKININYNLAKADLEISIAIPLGLIVNEIIVNSYKYAFPDDKKGEIEITLTKLEKKQFTLKITDNGVGFNGDENQYGGFGQRMINLLVKQIKAKMKTDYKNGCTYIFDFSNK